MRRVIRQQVYLDKQDKYNQLMRTHDTEMKTFFRLVNRQRSIKTMAKEILQYGGETHTSEEKVAEAFSEHFQKLATRADKPNYDEKYKLQVSFDMLLMELLAKEEKVQFKPVTPKEIMSISNLSRIIRPRTSMAYRQNISSWLQTYHLEYWLY